MVVIQQLIEQSIGGIMARRGSELANADLDMAFANDEFALVFQPKVDLATGKICGAEALCRWYHHSLGDLPPGVFISYMIRQGRLVELTRFTLTRGIEAAAAWHAEGHHFPVHINLSADDLNHGGLTQFLEMRLRHHGLSPQAVRIELSEAEVNNMPREARNNLRELLSTGVSLALQGPAEKAYHDSDEIPVAEFQLRGTALLGLAAALAEGQSGRVLGMIRAAKRLGRETTAIALETPLHVEMARDLGFDSATGYAFARPMPLEDLIYWADTRRPDAAPDANEAIALP